MNPLVSVIIPCYNASVTICDCLASLKSQTCVEWEAVCVDDGSIDTTIGAIRDEMRIDNRIKLLTQMNSGAAKAREAGIRHATGKYILFLDADDTLIPNALELMLNIFYCDSQIDIVASGFNILKEGELVKCRNIRWKQLDCISYLRRILSGKDGWELCAKMYKKDLFTNFLYIPQNLKSGEDAVVFVQLVSQSHKIGGCNISIYNYIQNTNSASHTRSMKNAEDTIRAAQIVESILKKNGLFKEVSSEMDAMFLLSYSNSTRKFRLAKKHPLVQCVKEHVSIRGLLHLPLYRIIYIVLSYLGGSYIDKLIKV